MRTRINWATLLADEARKNSVLRLDRIVARHGVNAGVARNALRRWEERGFVEHVSNKAYINRLNQHFTPRDLVNVLRPEAYVSLESALVDSGVTSQSPLILTCVTTGYPKVFRTPSVTVAYRRISPALYWGFQEKKTRYGTYRIAEPEKALLDWIYLNRQEGLPTPLDEINLHFVDPGKLMEYSKRFPTTVQREASQLLVESKLSG